MPACPPPPTTLWRRLRLAACDGLGTVVEPAAIVTVGGKVQWVGPENELPAGLRPGRTVDLADRWVTPGLVDCHTHLVFAGRRAGEFARRTAGTSYEQIAREGGGILSTVRATRAASEDELLAESRPRLHALMAEGVTAVEIKSGYGLEFEAEARMLRVARRLGHEHQVTVRTSLLAAHVLPPEFAGRPDEYLELVRHDWLPQLAPALADAVDAYCEGIAFSAGQCDRLFEAAQALGVPVRLHAEQLSNVGGTRMATARGALSCDHLEYAGDEEAALMARSGTVAVLLPVAFYSLAERRCPPIEALRRRGCEMAVASDCNPGSSPCASLLLAMNMARRLFGLTTDEVLAGVTRHAARALGLGDTHGVLEAGRAADFAVWSIDTPDELGYWTGFNPCSMVVRGGEIALERDV